MFSLFCSLFESLHRYPVAPNVDVGVSLELSEQVLNDACVKIFAAQKGVAIGRFDHKNAFIELKNRNIKGTTAQVKHGNAFVFCAAHAIGQGGSGRLVDDPEDIKICDATSIFGGLTLGVVEVGGYGDDGLGDLFTEISLSDGAHFLENHRADLGR